MSKKIHSYQTIVIAFFGIFTPCSVGFAGEPEIGRCHMDNCSWGMLMKKEIVGEKNDARLIKASIVGGTSYHNGGDYPDKYSKRLRIKWNSSPHTIYALCYKRLPVIVMEDQYTVIDFNNIPGVFESDASLYVRVCYHAKGVEAFSSSFVKKHGLGNPIMDEVKVSSPYELLRYVR